MKRISSLLFVLAISAVAAFAQTASTESPKTGNTTYVLQKTDDGYKVESTSTTATPTESAKPATAPAAGKSCCSKKGGSAAACSGKEAEAIGAAKPASNGSTAKDPN